MRNALSFFLLAATLLLFAAPNHAQAADGPGESLLIGPGDLLRIAVLGESDLSESVRVRDSGMVTLPLIGDVEVRGLSTAEASTSIARRYVDA